MCVCHDRPSNGCHSCNGGIQKTNTFSLSLQFAARKSIGLGSNQGKVYWNNVLIGNLAPSDYNIHTFTANLRAKVGQNILRIEGGGVSDGYGLTIDNVKLIKSGTGQNLVVNGDFETPVQNNKNKWSIYPGVLGWASNEI